MTTYGFSPALPVGRRDDAAALDAIRSRPALSPGRAPKDRVARPAGRRGPRRLHVGRARRPPRRRAPGRRSDHRCERRRHERRRDGGGLARGRDRRGAERSSKPSGAGPASTGPFPRPARASRPDARLLEHRPGRTSSRQRFSPYRDEPAQHQSFAGRDRRAHRLRSRARLHRMSRSSSARPMSGPARLRSSRHRSSRPIT